MVREISEYFIRGTNMKVRWVTDEINNTTWGYAEVKILDCKARGKNRAISIIGEQVG